MKKIAVIFLQYIFIFTFSFCIAQPVSAHGGEPRLEINLERVNPGGVVDVRGVEFDYEQTVTLYLERTGVVVQLGEVITDVEGIFVYFARLPVDLPEGVYNIRASTTHHDVLSPALAVQGPPILDESGGQGPRDEDDPLLAPMPTYAPGVVPGSITQSAPQPTSPITASKPLSPKGSSTTLLYSILLGIGIIALLGLRMLKKR